MTEAVDFLSKVRRLSAVDTYLSSFVDGIRIHTKQDGKLHVRLNQHIASTGRLSSTNPNMQNMPRGQTFPVKKVFVSRFDGGKIMEADFAQLEFRAAAYLSQDGVAIEEVSTGFDVHAYTAKVLPMLVNLRIGRLRRLTRLHRFMAQQALGERQRRQSITHTSRRSTKVSGYGIPDWLKKL